MAPNDPGPDVLSEEEPARELALLRARLEALERRLSLTPRQALPAGSFRFLECRVAGRAVGFLLDRVSEVVLIPELFELPEAPPWVAGLLDLRGASVPVLDVASRLDRRPRHAELSDLVVLASAGGRAVGLVVQEVRGVRAAEPGDVSEPARDLPHALYLVGACRAGGDPVLLLDVERLVSLSDVPEQAAS